MKIRSLVPPTTSARMASATRADLQPELPAVM